MTHCNPYLSFNDNCREAMTFYKECLGGELTLQTVAASPVADQMPATMKEAIVHATLKKGALIIMGSDLRREQLVEGNTVHLCVNCSSMEEIQSFFTNLSAGGQVIEPLAEMFWGDTYGALTDKYGKHWLFNYAKNQQ